MKALIAEGDDAVEPLIEALRRDTRWTGSVHFWRDFARSSPASAPGSGASRSAKDTSRPSPG